MTRILRLVLIITCFVQLCSFADTFIHNKNNTVYHGYIIRDHINNKITVQTVQNGPQNLNLVDYRILPNTIGRNNTVVVFSILEEINLEIETEAFEKAIIEEDQ